VAKSLYYAWRSVFPGSFSICRIRPPPPTESEFFRFKDEVLNDPDCVGARGVDESVFQDHRLLHLTVGTLALMGTYLYKVLNSLSSIQFHINCYLSSTHILPVRFSGDVTIQTLIRPHLVKAKFIVPLVVDCSGKKHKYIYETWQALM
jgi:hypothetical protein